MAAGSFVIDTSRTFAQLMLVSSGPKLKFQSADQDVTAQGERKWEVQVVGTWHPRNGMPATTEVLKVTIVGGSTEPANGLPGGTLVELVDFAVGMSAPEHNAKGGIKAASRSTALPLSARLAAPTVTSRRPRLKTPPDRPPVNPGPRC